MIISGIVKSSFVDYPGLISAVLFAPGCNYNCFYCHNRQLLSGPQEEISLDYIYKFLDSRRGLIDAVVITGGEPTLQKDLIPFLHKIKSLGFKLKLDTNGSKPNVVENILKENIVDYFAVDYKAPKSRYPSVAGCSITAEPVLKTINLLLESDTDFEARTTLFPGLSGEDIFQMAKEMPVLPRYVLNRYRKPENYLPGDLEKINSIPLSQSEISAIVKKIREYQPNICF
ncbi:MAG TPA: anaerobic ribonucleoside-triphosphate reductase activating protein [Clostridiales bacterium]|nr:anaerobic ribonucleoside-triphosphate reductase activating protein [Clostridiales bacterium]